MTTPAEPSVVGRSSLDAPPAVRRLIDTYTSALLSHPNPWAMAFLMVARTPVEGQAESLARFDVATHTVEATSQTPEAYAVVAQPASAFLATKDITEAIQGLGQHGAPGNRLLWVRIDRDIDAPFQDDTRPDYSPVQATWADLGLDSFRVEDLNDFEFLSRVDATVRPHYA